MSLEGLLYFGTGFGARAGCFRIRQFGCVCVVHDNGGAGEVLGTRQSGLPGLRLADLAIHEELVTIAHDDARLVLERDPQLESERGRALRTLLYLFRRDEAVQYLRAG